jgi:succinate dehydrogenase / fumarate reductase cytochrome b subunit
MGSEIGRVLLFGFTVSLYFHLFNGIRHLIWDAGYGFELDVMRKSGWLVLVISVVMTLLTFLVGYGSA